jgi:hypothetical protein
MISKVVQWLRLALSKALMRGGVSPETRKRYSLQNFVFYSFLEHWTIVKVQKPSNSECYIPSSELFRIHSDICFCPHLQYLIEMMEYMLEQQVILYNTYVKINHKLCKRRFHHTYPGVGLPASSVIFEPSGSVLNKKY